MDDRVVHLVLTLVVQRLPVDVGFFHACKELFEAEVLIESHAYGHFLYHFVDQARVKEQ